ncbi:hypothetical protein FACS1894190_14420 [Spirochaetia bacterium]|nr:hypothetical protein FACS1894190_14420 [Spirochaetia bacterium]
MKYRTAERQRTFIKLPAQLFASLLLLCAMLPVFSGCATATSAEEYYSIGMSYFEMGKFEEAERWLTRALTTNRTMRASEYNLGRIAYETGRYTEASTIFKKILRKDPSNVLVLRAEAYTQIKLGNIEEAGKTYKKVLDLESDSLDDGFNYALVLYAMDKPAEAEAELLKFDYNLLDNKDTLLLLARIQKAQDKLSAIDTYDQWLTKNTDPEVRYEYSVVLDKAGFYAKALEQAQKVQLELTADTETLKRYTVRFEVARLMLIADSEDTEGMTQLRQAIQEGFKDKEALNLLAKDEHIPKLLQEEIQRINDTDIPAAATP